MFEQKNFKNEDRTSNSISIGNMAANKRRKKSTKNNLSEKRIFPIPLC